MAQHRSDAPDALAVSLDDAKLYLRLEATSPAGAEDALLTVLLNAAIEWAEGVARRALISQEWQLTLPAFPAGEIRLPLGRCLAVLNVAYRNDAGTTITLTGPSSSPIGANYRENFLSDLGGLILPSYGESWPTTRDDEPAAVTVTYRAGYGPAASDVPAPIRQAILYRLADTYEHRGSQDGALTDIAKRALHPYALQEFGE